jgi:GAF domain-containing protein
MSDLSAFSRALSVRTQPDPIFAALEDLAADVLGHKLFTLMTVDHGARVARRAWSSHPQAYPVSGAKPLEDNDWSRAVLDRHEIWVMNSAEHIARVFPDHALIAALGCESSLNLPIVVAGQVLGTINCLNVAGHFTPARIDAAEALKVPGAAAFLLAARENPRKDLL